jgi:hypothetical protein
VSMTPQVHACFILTQFRCLRRRPGHHSTRMGTHDRGPHPIHLRRQRQAPRGRLGNRCGGL